MRKSELNPSNYKQVYDYYADKPISPSLTKFAHFVFSLMYKPHIRIDQKTKKTIDSRVNSGGRIIIAANHVNNQDQYVLGALMRNVDSLRPTISNTSIPAKAELFDNPLMRFGLDNMGALPTFRKDDQENASETAGDNHMNATKALIDLCVSKMLSGQHLAIFPEGTRNTGDPREVAKIKSGVSRIALRAAEVLPISILPVGIYYPDDNPKQVKVWIDEPINSPYPSRDELSSQIQHSLQYSVDSAHKIM